MSVNNEIDWLAAFPIRPATDAVEALCESWKILSAKHRPRFHPKSREPELTRVVKAHVENVTARQRGLLGMWSTEGVLNRVNLETGKLVEERRTDIVYGWNNESVGIQLVFEFKKLTRFARSRAEYLGEKGLRRYVDGIYAQRQPVAAMVGILIDPFPTCVPALRDALSDAILGPPLRLRRMDGHLFEQPSRLFSAADFDTEHDRPNGESSGGRVRVAHLFLSFGYPVATRKARKAR